MWNYIFEVDSQVKQEADGSLTNGTDHYSDPLAYIKANEKIYHEWQICELPDWAWSDSFSEVFCGESADGPLRVIADCRKQFVKDIPHSRAKAFVWYLKDGALVTFYRKQGDQITALKRYLWNWDGSRLTVEEWQGDYDLIVESLDIVSPRWHSHRQGVPVYPFPSSAKLPHDTYGKGSRIVVLSPDAAAKFPDSQTVNEKLRELADG